MARITISVVRTGQTIPDKVSSPSDAELDSVVAAYQNDANSFVGGTATYAQVLNFIVTQWFNAAKQRVQNANTTPAVVPAPINLN